MNSRNQSSDTGAVFVGWKAQLGNPLVRQKVLYSWEDAQDNDDFQQLLGGLDVLVHVLIPHQIAECLSEGDVGDGVESEVLRLPGQVQRPQR